MDLAGVDLVEELHQHKGVEDNGVVLAGRGMERRLPATVNIEQFIA